MHWTERLSEYLDDELEPADRAACSAHVATCAQCRETLDELRHVVGVAQAEGDLEPAADLWPGILARIEASPRSVARASAPRGQWTFNLAQLALAASLLVAATASATYVAARRGTPSPPSAEPMIQAMDEPMLAASADVTAANFADATFDEAVADLEQVLAEARYRLDPRTVIVIERNLAVIDGAIRQARAALKQDPANVFLNAHLTDARRRKLDLLRRATNLASTGGD
ncbi:MAG: anti-sigma factor family protein [Acidobacteriota bacterium]